MTSKKKPQHGYLYLIQVHPSRPWLHKIGITQKPQKRFDSLNEDNDGRNKLLRVIYVKGYERYEAWIKDYFSSRAYEYHPLKGNGSTEVFRFTWLDLAIITLAMEWWALMDRWYFRLAWGAVKLSAIAYAFHLLFPGIWQVLIQQAWEILLQLFIRPTA